MVISPRQILGDMNDKTKNMGVHWEYNGDLSGFNGDRMGFFTPTPYDWGESKLPAEAYNRNREHPQLQACFFPQTCRVYWGF